MWRDSQVIIHYAGMYVHRTGSPNVRAPRGEQALPGTTWIEPPAEVAWTSEQYCDPLLQAILARRFATAADAAAFLDPAPYRLPAGESLPNLDQAVRRIGRAIADAERIV